MPIDDNSLIQRLQGHATGCVIEDEKQVGCSGSRASNRPLSAVDQVRYGGHRQGEEVSSGVLLLGAGVVVESAVTNRPKQGQLQVPILLKKLNGRHTQEVTCRCFLSQPKVPSNRLVLFNRTQLLVYARR